MYLHNTIYQSLRGFTAVLALLVLWACSDRDATQQTGSGQSAPEKSTPLQTITLALTLITPITEDIVVDLTYARPPESAGPRVMELWLQPSANLVYQSAEALDAATAAGKQLVVQEGEKNGTTGLIRVVLFGTQNLDSIESGGLARFTFSRTDATPASLAILDIQPIFAPMEANDGMVLPAPLIIGGPQP